MDSLDLPPEIMAHVVSYLDKPTLRVSKDFNSLTELVIGNLLKNCSNSPLLKEYNITPINFQDETSNLKKYSNFFLNIKGMAQQLGIEVKPTSSTHELEKIANQINIERKAENFNQFFQKYILTSEHTSRDFYLELQTKTLASEKATLLQNWMENNQNDLSQLRDFNVLNHGLTEVPEQIRYFTGLKTLNLAMNQIKTLPPEIFTLTQLKELILGKNQLTILPPEIGALTQLRLINLRNNELRSIPPEIGALTKLEYISLSNNFLETLPQQINSLTLLTLLNLSNNHLTQLPQINALGNQAEGIAIDITGNRFQQFPLELRTVRGYENAELPFQDN